MPRSTFTILADISDEAYQERILPHVSRTFALTIPELPPQLRRAVTSAYLLCRIADTIEDEPALCAEDTYRYLKRFAAVVAGHEDPAPLAREVAAHLSEQTLPAERDLVRNMERVIRMTGRLGPEQRTAVRRCINLMCYGMHHFQRTASLSGLGRLADLDSYCYYVAGVVGEMLTELFCSHSAGAAEHRGSLRELATSFGQGLQMTNILKDLWDDRSRGACWLPREVFARHGIDLSGLQPLPFDPRFGAALKELVGIAHAHLRNALAFTLLIPRDQPGIRRFCLWSIGLAVLTLRSIARRPEFTSGADVKVSHAAVAVTRLATSVFARSDRTLVRLFEWAGRDLPAAAPNEASRHSRAASIAAQEFQAVMEHPPEAEVVSMRFGRVPFRSDGSAAP
ncbi:MAG TPA: phytoene/squalene synthase family protein [Steroidobacteraceae bacterium]|nr:phytoene/squalene synthase family protein [Steroidobacteraceae bacterium]